MRLNPTGMDVHCRAATHRNNPVSKFAPRHAWLADFQFPVN
jgi:hypothetical protein